MQQVSTTLRPLSFDAEGSQTVILESSSTSWQGLPFEVHRTIPGELDDAGPAQGSLGLLVFLEGAVEMAGTKAGRDFNYRAPPGTTLFMSGDRRSSVRAVGSADVAVVPMPPEWFRLVELEGDPDIFGELPPLIADPNMRSLVDMMRREVEASATTGRLYAESLSLALMSYVLEHRPAARLRVHGRLSEAQCRRLRGYIQERLGEDLALSELACFSGVGTRHFSRLFREGFGITPHQYVLEQRLKEGARLLASGGRDVAEIALSLGFSSQSHFASAFRKRFGQTPRGYAVQNRGSRRGRF